MDNGAPFAWLGIRRYHVIGIPIASIRIRGSPHRRTVLREAPSHLQAGNPRPHSGPRDAYSDFCFSRFTGKLTEIRLLCACKCTLRVKALDWFGSKEERTKSY
jgi:hypothetical protein